MNPKTSGLPLSAARVGNFKEEARDTFERSCIARLILNKVERDPHTEGDFRKIGINHIVDRIWFVDGDFGDTVFGTPSGAQYGIAVAEEESRLVLESLFRRARENRTEYVTEMVEEFQESETLRFFTDLESKRFRPTAVISSLDLSARFWDFKTFAPTRAVRRGLTSPEGEYDGIPVLHSRLLPDGVILSVNREELGMLEVKADFDIWVSDIVDAQEQDHIRRTLPSLADADLSEKTRVLCYETVKTTILERKPCVSFAILARKSNELILKKFD